LLHQAFLQTISGNRRGPAASVARLLLQAAEPGFAAAASLRGALYDRQILRTHAAPRPVISVGNITTGGTGKTPIVLWLADAVAKRGRRPAVLLRGYKSNAAGSDEAQLLRERLVAAAAHSAAVPVIANADRLAAAQTLARSTPQVDLFILDDGFQHRRLAREFDLVLIDATQPFGFGHLLPRGLLREAPRSLARADAILLTRCDQIAPEQLAPLKEQVQQYAPEVPMYFCDFVPDGWIGTEQTSAAAPSGPCLAVCGIGNPGAFEQSARRAGAEVAKMIALDDHHNYTADDVRRLAAECRAIDAAAVVTTEKDLTKLRALLATMTRPSATAVPAPAIPSARPPLPPCWALRIAPRFSGDDESILLQRILAATQAPARARNDVGYEPPARSTQ
jgi:tetraacyldisaccharide 4'-kinase